MEARYTITPPGVVGPSPFAHEPDRTHGLPGQYHLTIEVEASAAAPLIAEIERQAQEFHEQANPLAYAPYSVNGETVTFTFKRSAGTRTGKKLQKPPAIYDQTAAPAKDIRIIKGTRVRVSFEIKPFRSNLFGAGVKLKLNAIQALSGFAQARAASPSHGFAA